jgi:hypothetical protein
MNRLGALTMIGVAAAAGTAAWSGHELPIYPSYYPHEIEVRTLAPDQAAEALRQGKIQAHIGPLPRPPVAPPDQVRAIESLGALVVVRSNPQTRLTAGETCAAVKSVARQAAAVSGLVPHPYPVTPFHGDYLHHADLAADAKRRLDEDPGVSPIRGLRVKASDALRHPDWTGGGSDWDVEVVAIDAADLTRSAMLAMNGWLAPPWVRAGWFHAEQLLGVEVAGRERNASSQRLQSDLQRLRSGDFGSLTERINLERDAVAVLAGGCRTMVVGYTVKREYVNVEYSVGIENIGFDAIDGLRSPIFIRTVKLKDFPWNGWLALGLGEAPAAAWNPIGGMTDPFGRLINFAAGDPALLPSPYDAGWMLNRIADLPLQPGP